MKYIAVLCAVIFVVQGKVLPERLSSLVCSKSDLDYDKCVRTSLEKFIPQLVNGVPELNFPPIDPLELPFVTIDRTLNDLVSINAVLKKVKVVGASNFRIDALRADQHNESAEIRVTFPWTHVEMDYDVKGQLLIVPLRSKGFFAGNFTNTQLYAKGTKKLVDRNGVQFFKVDKFSMKIRVGDGEIKLLSENPDLQFGADLIANFYNDNPRRVMDAINPIFVRTATELYRMLFDQLLSAVPAKELI